MMRRGLVAALALALSACAPRPRPANPALWAVSDGHDAKAWLFGTIHVLPAPLAWRTARVSAALAASDELAVEIANVDDDAAVSRSFAAVATTPFAPPLASRVPVPLRAPLAALLASAGMAPHALDHDKSWAAALALASLSANAADAANGIDRALLAGAHPRLLELEGAPRQFAVFDRLPESGQRLLLADAISGAATAAADSKALARAWARGDIATLAREGETGALADPGLHAALATRRTRGWAQRIIAEIRAGHRPFVAVGTAHMLGDDGLVALLGAAGYSVQRVE